MLLELVVVRWSLVPEPGESSSVAGVSNDPSDEEDGEAKTHWR